jgi:hypothetical protein
MTEHGEGSPRTGMDGRFPVPPTRAAVPDWYPELLDAVAERVRTGRQRAVSAANQELVSTYWAVGAEILARQQAEGWGARASTGSRPTCVNDSRMPRDSRRATSSTCGRSPRRGRTSQLCSAALHNCLGVNTWCF